MSTCFLHVPDPDDQPFDGDEPNKPIAPGDRWCSLWAPREPGGPRARGTMTANHAGVMLPVNV